MIQLRQFAGDLRRIMRGVAAFYRVLRAPERLPLGLGELSAEAGRVVLGQLSRYDIRVANGSAATHAVTLGLDFYPRHAPLESAVPCAHVATRLTLPSHTATAVTVHYDWRAVVHVSLDGRPALPDEVWHQEGQAPYSCVVRALLRDAAAHCVEQLTITQEVSR
jgi:hypothetical protein